MRPPRHVQVGPHRYKIVQVSDGILGAAGTDGLCKTNHNVIAFEADRPSSQKADTVLHEVLHAMLGAVKIDDDLEEQVVLVLAPALLQLIQANPKLVRFLVGG